MTTSVIRDSYVDERPSILALCRERIGDQIDSSSMRKGNIEDLGFHPKSVLSVLQFIVPHTLCFDAVYGREFIAVRVAPEERYRIENARVEFIHVYGTSMLKKEGIDVTDEQIRDLFKLADGEVVGGWKKI